MTGIPPWELSLSMVLKVLPVPMPNSLDVGFARTERNLSTGQFVSGSVYAEGGCRVRQGDAACARSYGDAERTGPGM